MTEAPHEQSNVDWSAKIVVGKQLRNENDNVNY